MKDKSKFFVELPLGANEKDMEYLATALKAVDSFTCLLDGISNLPLMMEMANVDDSDFLDEEHKKKPTKAQKIVTCRWKIMDDLLDRHMEWDIRNEGPVAVAKHLQGLAKTWGVTLPADWLEQARKFLPEGVAVETEEEE